MVVFGGIFVLVKYVLENLYVYLLSSKAILEKIRSRIFSFLWFGNMEKVKTMHF